MTKVLIDVEQDLLCEAAVTLAESEPTALANAALKHAVQAARERRRESLCRLFDEGAFDLSVLDELDR